MNYPEPLIIGICGGSGSGKTTVARAILTNVGEHRITFISHDSYYRDLSHLPFEERSRVNFDHPDSLETELLIKHLLLLKKWMPIEIPVYDFTIHARTAVTIPVVPHPVILVDGILIFSDKALRELFDIKIYVDTDPDIRFIRRLERDIAERGRTMESVINQYLTTVRPMHLEFVEPSKRYADVIIPEGGMNTVALDMVIAMVEELLREKVQDNNP